MGDKTPLKGNLLSFPNKVYQLLEYAQAQDLESVISWRPEGTSFGVYKTEEFMEKLASRFFPNHSTFRSFERLLNIWGFKRLPTSDKMKMYQHECFRRGQPFLCNRITRIQNQGTNKKRVNLGGVLVNNSIPATARIHQAAALNFLLQKQNHNLPASTFLQQPLQASGQNTLDLVNRQTAEAPKGSSRMMNQLSSPLAKMGHGQGLLRGRDPFYCDNNLIGCVRDDNGFSCPREYIIDRLGSLGKNFENRYMGMPDQFQDASNSPIQNKTQRRTHSLDNIQEQEEALWERYFDELRSYLQVYKTCNVPEKSNPQLSTWVAQQRLLLQRGEMSKLHEAKLDAIGFVWEIPDRLSIQPDTTCSSMPGRL